ncbi:MAG: response regulator transcription factor [Anaerolineales bacterium]|nr:response regulator transcription factor [Anaerolineales bacterium]
MSIWHKLLYWIGLRSNPGPRTFEIAESLHTSVTTLAQHEGRTINEIFPDLLAAGLTQYSTNDRFWKKWESLTPREQEVTALLCLGYSNKEIAVRMGVTEAAVKFHLRNVYSKFRVKNRSKLRQILAGWDFSGWM